MVKNKEMLDLQTYEPSTCFFVKPNENSVSDAMISAHKSLVNHKISAVWINFKEMIDLIGQVDSLHIPRIFICDPFEGSVYNYLLKNKSSLLKIIGPYVLLKCIKEGKQIPILDHPLYNLSMENMIVCCTNIQNNQKIELYKRVSKMNGIISKHLTTEVTHLVTTKVGSKKYILAVELGIPVYTPLWIDQVWDKGNSNRLIHATQPEFDEFKCPIFYGLVITVSQMELLEKQEAKRLIERYGGKYTGDMKLNEVTHLILKEPKGMKYQYAKKWGNVQIVKDTWLRDCLLQGRFQVENPYHFADVHKSKDSAVALHPHPPSQSTPTNNGSGGIMMQTDLLENEDLLGLSRISRDSGQSWQPALQSVPQTCDRTVKGARIKADNESLSSPTTDQRAMVSTSGQKPPLEGVKIFCVGFDGDALEFLRGLVAQSQAQLITAGDAEAELRIIDRLTESELPRLGSSVSITPRPTHVMINSRMRFEDMLALDRRLFDLLTSRDTQRATCQDRQGRCHYVSEKWFFESCYLKKIVPEADFPVVLPEEYRETVDKKLRSKVGESSSAPSPNLSLTRDDEVDDDITDDDDFIKDLTVTEGSPPENSIKKQQLEINRDILNQYMPRTSQTDGAGISIITSKVIEEEPTIIDSSLVIATHHDHTVSTSVGNLTNDDARLDFSNLFTKPTKQGKKLVFLNKVFMLFALDSAEEEVANKIKQYKGTVLKRRGKKPIDYVVCPFLLPDPVPSDLSARVEKCNRSLVGSVPQPELVTPSWVDGCSETGSLLESRGSFDDYSLALFNRPAELYTTEGRGMEVRLLDRDLLAGCKVCLTQFEGRQRQLMKDTVVRLGASYDDTLTLTRFHACSSPTAHEATTHLLALKPIGQKYESALKFVGRKLQNCSLPKVVKPAWLVGCLETRRKLPEGDFCYNEGVPEISTVPSEPSHDLESSWDVPSHVSHRSDNHSLLGDGSKAHPCDEVAVEVSNVVTDALMDRGTISGKDIIQTPLPPSPESHPYSSAGSENIFRISKPKPDLCHPSPLHRYSMTPAKSTEQPSFLDPDKSFHPTFQIDDAMDAVNRLENSPYYASHKRRSSLPLSQVFQEKATKTLRLMSGIKASPLTHSTSQQPRVIKSSPTPNDIKWPNNNQKGNATGPVRDTENFLPASVIGSDEEGSQDGDNSPTKFRRVVREDSLKFHNHHCSQPSDFSTPQRMSAGSINGCPKVLIGLVIAVGKKLSMYQQSLNQVATDLGADIKWIYDKQCTHLIFQGKPNERSREYCQAKQDGKYVVSPDWLMACQQNGARLSESLYPHTHNPRLFLHNLSPIETPRYHGKLSSVTHSHTPRMSTFPTSPPKVDEEGLSELEPLPLADIIGPLSSTNLTQANSESVLSSNTSLEQKTANLTLTPLNQRSNTNVTDMSLHHQTIEKELVDIMSKTKGSKKRRLKRIASSTFLNHEEQPQPSHHHEDALHCTNDATRDSNAPDHTTESSDNHQHHYNNNNLQGLSSSEQSESQNIQITWEDPIGKSEREKIVKHISMMTTMTSSRMDLTTTRVGCPLGSSGHDTLLLTPRPSGIIDLTTPETSKIVEPNANSTKLSLPKNSGGRHFSPDSSSNSIPHVPSIAFHKPLAPAAEPTTNGTCNNNYPANTLDMDDDDFTVSFTEFTSIQNQPRLHESATKVSNESRQIVNPVFMLSALCEEDKIKYSAIIENLGGKLSSLSCFDPLATHLIVESPMRTEKYLGSIAKGLWILHKSYLEASRQANKFVKETCHEWGSPSTEPLIVGMSLNQKILVKAARKWRLTLHPTTKYYGCDDDGMSGAFSQWVVLLYISPSHVNNIERLLKAGNGRVVHYTTSAQTWSAQNYNKFLVGHKVTHAFIDLPKLPPTQKVDLEVLVRCNVKCLKPDYIPFYLCDPSGVLDADYVIDEVKRFR